MKYTRFFAAFLLAAVLCGLFPPAAALAAQESPALSSLELTGATLNEPFSPERTAYTADAAAGATTVSVRAGSDSGSIRINDVKLESGKTSEPIPISSGDTLITILLTGEDGTATKTVTVRVKKASDYSELYRPQLHYTPQQFWCNDPNGLVYNAETGLYHFFYQYNPGVLYHDGQSHWGHAVSSDLVHWTELSTALYPDENGIIASGSAVIDRNNTSGLFDESVPAESRMVAVFTYISEPADPEAEGAQRQAIAYSKDGGLTWTKYSGNPVIPNAAEEYGADFRDPKVMWMEESGEWLMVVAGGRARIFTSPDLIHWTHNSDLSYADGEAISSECPDLLPLPVDGEEGNIKWIYTGSGAFYVIGDLVREDGKYIFKAESERLSLYEGAYLGGSGSDLYATQSFSNMPDGRTVLLSWIGEQTAEMLKRFGKTWNGTFSMPLEARLVTVNGQVRLATCPIAEMDSLRGETLYEGTDITVTPDSENILAGVEGSLCDLEAEIEIGDAASFGFHLRTGNGMKTTVRYTPATGLLTVDKKQSGLAAAEIKSMRVEPLDGNRVKLRILIDSSVLDVFVNDGLTVTSTVCFPTADACGMEFFSSSGSVTVKSIAVYEMNSIWSGAEAEIPKPYLTDLTLSGSTLSVPFEPTLTQYSAATVENSTDRITLGVAYAEALSVSCAVNGKNVAAGDTCEIPLEVGENQIRVSIRDTQGVREYTVTLTREKADFTLPAVLFCGVILAGTLVCVTLVRRKRKPQQP